MSTEENRTTPLQSVTADAAAPVGGAAPTPWDELDPSGAGLTVDAFITTLMSQIGNALRRTITQPYAEQFDLTVSEWRVLSLVAHAGRIAFSDLVAQSTSDKALISRTLKLLANRGLVLMQEEGSTPRKKVFCAITRSGEELHRQVIPIARARQAAALRTLSPEERATMYRSLLKLREFCLGAEITDRRGRR